MTMAFAPVAAEHDLSRLDSGNIALDRWLARSALHAEAMRTTRTFVWSVDGTVVAYYALAAHSVPRADVPSSLGHGSPAVIPAYLLAKIALAQRLQGRGLGSSLLGDAMERCLLAGVSAGARLVVVDAADMRAATFYRARGFTHTLVPGRLAQKIGDVAEAYLGDPA